MFTWFLCLELTANPIDKYLTRLNQSFYHLSMNHTSFIISADLWKDGFTLHFLTGAIHRHFESTKRSEHESNAVGKTLETVNETKKKRSRRHRVSNH